MIRLSKIGLTYIVEDFKKVISTIHKAAEKKCFMVQINQDIIFKISVTTIFFLRWILIKIQVFFSSYMLFFAIYWR